MWDLILSVPDHCLSFYIACNFDLSSTRLIIVHVCMTFNVSIN